VNRAGGERGVHVFVENAGHAELALWKKLKDSALERE
jgi:hypothetical protein